MSTKHLRIKEYPHLLIAAQDDEALHRRLLSSLIASGFQEEAGTLVSPPGASGQEVIAAITAAFQAAKQK
ncbi:hypothetical protein Barb4_05357 [Bacteroidales bacterium Barb4]|jgi:hypothetical protein|nr:hypothetical protein Barb4_05357 [Bacteroidales bacterium Barb4]